MWRYRITREREEASSQEMERLERERERKKEKRVGPALRSYCGGEGSSKVP